MRKWNGIIGFLIIILFFAHGIIGGLQLIGTLNGGIRAAQILSRALVVLILIHAVIGIKLTYDSLTAVKKSGVSYTKENKKFWAVRISGFAIFVLIFFHVIIFMGQSDGAYRLNDFGVVQLVLQLLLLASIFVHVVCNVKPQLISLGIKSLRDYAFDIIIVLSGVLIFAGIAFVVYYLRWAAI